MSPPCPGMGTADFGVMAVGLHPQFVVEFASTGIIEPGSGAVAHAIFGTKVVFGTVAATSFTGLSDTGIPAVSHPRRPGRGASPPPRRSPPVRR
jgi:hypothetical protein